MRDSSQGKPIKYPKAKAVPQDVASFEETQETLALLKILALSDQDVVTGWVKPVPDVVARLRAKRAAVRWLAPLPNLRS